eukprot:m.64244 g.64244  ORF g.64244 m.64244 type:complete len:487 (-) comp13915_c0_seq1:496-1956(-)
MFLLDAKKKAEREEEHRKRIQRRQAEAGFRSPSPERERAASPVQRSDPPAIRSPEARRRSQQEIVADRRKNGAVDYNVSLDAAVARTQISSPTERVVSASTNRVASAELRGDLVASSVDVEDDWEDVVVSCGYVGTFELQSSSIDKKEVKQGIRAMQQYMNDTRPADLIVSLEGLKVIDTAKQTVAMAHSLVRINMSTTDREYPLFGVVAKNPGSPKRYCHVFAMRLQEHANEIQAVMGKAFKMAYARKHARKMPAVGASPSSAAGMAARRASSQSQIATPDDANKKWARSNPILSAASPAPDAPEGGRRMSFLDVQPLPRPQIRASPGGPARSAAAPPKEKKPVLDVHNAVWYQASIPREIAMELIEKSEDGAFILRNSQSQPGNYALTLKAGGLMHHFLIQSEARGLRLGQPEHNQPYFAQLGELIMNYARPDQGLLPCPLDLDCFNRDFDDKEKPAGDQDIESYVDPDYQTLKEIRAKMGRAN